MRITLFFDYFFYNVNVKHDSNLFLSISRKEKNPVCMLPSLGS